MKSKAAEAALARIFTVAGTLAVMGVVQSFASSIPGTSSVIIGSNTLGSWLSLVLVPAMAVVSLRFLRPSRDLAVGVLYKSVKNPVTIKEVEQHLVTAVYSLTMVLVLMLFYYFARQSLENPILIGVTNLRVIMDISVAVLGILALFVFAVNLIKLVKFMSASLAKNLVGSDE